jgi:hypothetical protein
MDVWVTHASNDTRHRLLAQQTVGIATSVIKEKPLVGNEIYLVVEMHNCRVNSFPTGRAMV